MSFKYGEEVKCPECESNQIYYVETVIQYYCMDQFPTEEEEMELSHLDDSYSDEDLLGAIWCYDCDKWYSPANGKEIEAPIRGELGYKEKEK